MKKKNLTIIFGVLALIALAWYFGILGFPLRAFYPQCSTEMVCDVTGTGSECPSQFVDYYGIKEGRLIGEYTGLCADLEMGECAIWSEPYCGSVGDPIYGRCRYTTHTDVLSYQNGKCGETVVTTTQATTTTRQTTTRIEDIIGEDYTQLALIGIMIIAIIGVTIYILKGKKRR